MIDPIADYLTRIRNAIKARHKKVDIPASNLKKNLTKILLDHQFIQNYIQIDDGKQGLIRIYLKYGPGDKPVIKGLQSISTPGRRVYVNRRKIPRVMNNLGIAIVTTSKGLMTNLEAQKLGVGGEVICYIW